MRNATGPTPRWSCAVALRGGATWLALVVLGGAGCSLDGLLQSDEVPPHVTDPAITDTPDGALAAYYGTLALFRGAFGGGDSDGRGSDLQTSAFVPITGLLSDELRIGNLSRGEGLLRILSATDNRNILEGDDLGGDVEDQAFGNLQQVRGQTRQAIGLVTRHLPEQRALAGHLYALAGYAEVFLAELFCSGIPLSTLDFEGNYTLKPGSPTAEVFAHAVALFDTAQTLVGDSARLVHLAAVGKGRALLNLEQYGAAAAAVAAVPDTYRYEVSYSGATGAKASNFARQEPSHWTYAVADQEGETGLAYVTSGDPRTPVTLQNANNGWGYPVYFPANYLLDGSSPIVLASGVEARLMEAEAALEAGAVGTWLAKLNTLRQTAISPALADTTDPGTLEGRVDLLFRERAFWLFLTGHRQGDLRRLIRQYGRSPETVYPGGQYPGGGFYGSDVTLPIPWQERVANPLFTGCASRGA